MNALYAFLAAHWPAITAGWHWFMSNVAPVLVVTAIPSLITGLRRKPNGTSGKIVTALSGVARFFSWAEHHDLPGTFRAPVLSDVWLLLKWLATKSWSGPMTIILAVSALGTVGIVSCATSPQVNEYRSLEGVAAAAKPVKDAFRIWNAQHERALGCGHEPQPAACTAWRHGKVLLDVVKADKALQSIFMSWAQLVQTNPKADPGKFIEDATRALADLVAAVNTAQLALPVPQTSPPDMAPPTVDLAPAPDLAVSEGGAL